MERYKDLIFEEAIIFPDGSIQVNGNDFNGNEVWILIHGVGLKVFTGPREEETS